MDNWISVKDRLPEYQQFCLLVEVTKVSNETDLKTFYLGWLECEKEINALNDMWFLDGDGRWVEKESITHWMPLPEPPKE